MKADPKLGRAAALRDAMLAYVNDKSSPLNASRHSGGRSPSSEREPQDEDHPHSNSDSNRCF